MKIRAIQKSTRKILCDFEGDVIPQNGDHMFIETSHGDALVWLIDKLIDYRDGLVILYVEILERE